jgi:hypothetical protein
MRRAERLQFHRRLGTMKFRWNVSGAPWQSAA